MEFFTEGVAIMQVFVTGLGGALALWGLVNLAEGYGSDNAGAKSAGIKLLAAGGFLVMIGCFRFTTYRSPLIY